MAIRPHTLGVEVRFAGEAVLVQPWGRDSLRVRAAMGEIDHAVPGALQDMVPAPRCEIDIGVDAVRLVNGAITAEITLDHGQGGGEGGPYPMVRFLRTGTQVELLADQRAQLLASGPRVFRPIRDGRYRIEQHFRAHDDERLFGLGQHPDGRFDRKGLVVDLIHRNGDVAIPFMVSSRGYGFLWNNPAVGHVELALNRTRWVADAARQIDYWVTAGLPSDVLGGYADATGHPPELPEWASGFWQGKLRYQTQVELLGIAHEFKRRQLPLSVLVIDYFHSVQVGDWDYDPEDFPDPASMARELHDLGVRLMVSVWPIVSPLSPNHDAMRDQGMFVSVESGTDLLAAFPDKGFATPRPARLVDPTNPAAREFLWSVARRHYVDRGVDLFWLDACEPAIQPLVPSNLQFDAGRGDEVLNLYPRDLARAFHDGLVASGRAEVISLARAAWAGSQRCGTAVWSGDTMATFESLLQQVRAGLNMSMSGIPWWTSDIGGFQGGDPASPEYRELMIRWFQFGTFCPLFRMHGVREPRPWGTTGSGGPNEPWSYGDEATRIMAEFLTVRERIRPYLMAQMRRAHADGLPPMRPLFVDAPDDTDAWSVTDQFMLGPDLIVAPIVQAGARSREVYVPPGAWEDARTGAPVMGPRRIEVQAGLDSIPLLVRAGGAVAPFDRSTVRTDRPRRSGRHRRPRAPHR